MKNMLSRYNLHEFLHKQDNKKNSFIANINTVVNNFDIIANLNNLLTAEDIKVLTDFFEDEVSVKALLEDLSKGSLEGMRKLDINLLHNMYDYQVSMTVDEKQDLWNTLDKQLYYDTITVYFRDGTRVDKDFNIMGVPVLVRTHQDLYEQLIEWPEFMTKIEHTRFSVFSDGELGDWGVLRIYDGEEEFSNISRVVLTVSDKDIDPNYNPGLAKAKSWEPSYSWAASTSALQLVTQYIAELVTIGHNIQPIVMLYDYREDLLDLAAVTAKLASNDPTVSTIHSNLEILNTLYQNLGSLLDLNSQIFVRIDEMNKTKANKIMPQEVTIYNVTSSISDPNVSISYTAGDLLTSEYFSAEVLTVDGIGRITAYALSPEVVLVDLTSKVTFTGGSGLGFSLDIVCTEQHIVEETEKDLLDVYEELKEMIHQSIGVEHTSGIVAKGAITANDSLVCTGQDLTFTVRKNTVDGLATLYVRSSQSGYNTTVTGAMNYSDSTGTTSSYVNVNVSDLVFTPLNAVLGTSLGSVYDGVLVDKTTAVAYNVRCIVTNTSSTDNADIGNLTIRISG